MEESSAKKRILVIEDEKRISMLLEVNLTMAGYLCDTAFDGEEGLAKALTGNFDLILLDIMLPKRGDLRFTLSKIFATFLPNSANTGRTSFFLI